MLEELESFVLAADEVARLQRAQTSEAEWFRAVAEEGHNGGRAPGVSRQGLYAATAGGRFLASINTRSPERMVAMLQEARERWDALPEEERRATRDAGGERPEDRYPEGGLALVVHMRDLPREDLPDDWRAEARNLDRAWFQREELPGLLPPEPGRRRSEGPVDPALVQRLARLHLVDNVRGQAPLFRPERVVKAELTVRVVRTRRGRAHLEYTGRARLEEEGRWAVEHPGRRKVEADRRRGYAAALRGEAVWNLDEQRFESFELVAAGPRWGATQFNGRYDDEGPAGMGVLFSLAPEGDRLAPAYHWAYPALRPAGQSR